MVIRRSVSDPVTLRMRPPSSVRWSDSVPVLPSITMSSPLMVICDVIVMSELTVIVVLSTAAYASRSLCDVAVIVNAAVSCTLSKISRSILIMLMAQTS